MTGTGERPARTFGRYLLVALLVAAVVALTLIERQTGWLAQVSDQQRLRALVEAAGPAGPMAVVLLLALAIVVSPLPSAPIGMAAGAAYGPFWGSVLTVAGACLGALAAFGIARFVAYDAVRRWKPVREPLEWLEKGHSQNWLMAAVFLTRLAPFLSFDAISYAAGLTPLRFWRFALATVAGVTPISIMLAYGGNAAIDTGLDPVVTILIFGGITGIPILARLLWVWLRGERR